MRTGVAIALYNGRRFLKEQIDSLLYQTIKPDIIVCCDDGSTDGTMQWLSDYVNELGEAERFLLVQNEKNLGYVRNFYKALDLCDADYMFLCDQDDIWAPNKIEKMVEVFDRNRQWKLISCAHDLIDAEGQSISSVRYSVKRGSGVVSAVSEREIVTYFNWPGMTMAIRREFWMEIKENAIEIKAPHDRVLALLASSQGAMGYFDLPLCSHRLHTSNSGGEEDSLKTMLSRSFKKKELSTSLKWLDEQLNHRISFSVAAQDALQGYRDYVALRAEAMEKESWIPLLSALVKCRQYVNPKGLLADAASILLRRD